jgi:hypothetical protein
LDDLIVGAYFAISTHNQIIQAIYVVFGKANNSAINLSDIANANNPTGGFVINGEHWRLSYHYNHSLPRH